MDSVVRSLEVFSDTFIFLSDVKDLPTEVCEQIGLACGR